MPDTKLKELVINECSTVPSKFEPNQLYLTPDTTEEDIAETLKQAKEYTDEQVGDVETSLNNYATKAYVDGLVGDIETALNNINSGG